MIGAVNMTDRLIAALASASRRYGGEPVSELAHSLQCAELAEAAAADEELVVASLLHDVGRFAVDPGLIDDATESPPPSGGRGRGHHELGAALIAPHVSVRVAWLVRMHVPAKRYLCATEPDYLARLTPVSRRTLGLQGGVMTAEEVAALNAHPWLSAAVSLRRWDDEAKVAGKTTRPIEAWTPLLRRLLSEAPRTAS
jgi:predicted HD phosphohydrolase